MSSKDNVWKDKLTQEQYRITREHGTERPFTGEYNDYKGDGTFLCVCCGKELFKGEHKYDSGSGWPSFWQPVKYENVAEHNDDSFGMRRTEIRCSECDAHLGHSFPDGPKPTGIRYCINSASLKLKEE